MFAIKSYRIMMCLGVLSMMASACSDAPETAEIPAEEVSASSNVEPKTTESTLGPVHVVVSLSDPNPVLGQPIVLKLIVDAAQDVTVTMPEFGDQMSRFSIADYKQNEQLRPDGRNEYTQSYTLDLPMSGKLNTPSFLIEFVDNRQDSEQKGSIQEILTTPISFEVQSVFAEGETPDALYPMLGTMSELVLPEARKSQTWKWILIAVCAAFAIAGVVVFKTRKKIIPALPPDIVALRALDKLKYSGIPTDSVGIDKWYVELSGIVRKYIEDKFALNAPRLTTEEFFVLAQKSNALTTGHKTLIHTLLEHSDRVKFTDFIPTQAESRAMLENARRFVTESSQLPNGGDHA